MTPSTGNLALFTDNTTQGNLEGMICIYMNDVLGARTEKFENVSTKTEKRFDAKQSIFVTFTFACKDIEKTPTHTYMHQPSQEARFTHLSPDCTFDDLRRKRHAISWIVPTRIDVSTAFALAAAVTINSFEQRHVR